MRMKTVSGLLSVVLLSGCSNAAKDSKADMQSAQGTGISADQSAPIEKAEIDRFSEQAGHLMVRSATNGLPAANASINFDQGPFLTRGLTASGRSVQYYNFDVQSTNPAPIYVLFYEGASEPVANQMNIIDALPGEAGYSDFWKVIKVTVPADYTANSIKSFEELTAAKFPIEKTDLIGACP